MSAKTVRVRMAVAVNYDGMYEAAGADNQDDGGRKDNVEEWLCDRSGQAIAVHFVEADIPLPEPPESVTVEGEVGDG